MCVSDERDARPGNQMVTGGDEARWPSPIFPRSALNLGWSRTGSNSTAAVIRIRDPSRSSNARSSEEKRLSKSEAQMDQGDPHRRHIAVRGAP